MIDGNRNLHSCHVALAPVCIAWISQRAEEGGTNDSADGSLSVKDVCQLQLNMSLPVINWLKSGLRTRWVMLCVCCFKLVCLSVWLGKKI